MRFSKHICRSHSTLLKINGSLAVDLATAEPAVQNSCFIISDATDVAVDLPLCKGHFPAHGKCFCLPYLTQKQGGRIYGSPDVSGPKFPLLLSTT